RLPEPIALTKHLESEDAQESGKEETQNPGRPEQHLLDGPVHGVRVRSGVTIRSRPRLARSLLWQAESPNHWGQQPCQAATGMTAPLPSRDKLPICSAWQSQDAPGAYRYPALAAPPWRGPARLRSARSQASRTSCRTWGGQVEVGDLEPAVQV